MSLKWLHLETFASLYRVHFDERQMCGHTWNILYPQVGALGGFGESQVGALPEVGAFGSFNVPQVNTLGDFCESQLGSLGGFGEPIVVDLEV